MHYAPAKRTTSVWAPLFGLNKLALKCLAENAKCPVLDEGAGTIPREPGLRLMLSCPACLGRSRMLGGSQGARGPQCPQKLKAGATGKRTRLALSWLFDPKFSLNDS